MSDEQQSLLLIFFFVFTTACFPGFMQIGATTINMNCYTHTHTQTNQDTHTHRHTKTHTRTHAYMYTQGHLCCMIVYLWKSSPKITQGFSWRDEKKMTFNWHWNCVHSQIYKVNLFLNKCKKLYKFKDQVWCTTAIGRMFIYIPKTICLTCSVWSVIKGEVSSISIV